MGFIEEPSGYEKTVLSDLQGAWIILRESVVEEFGFPDSDKLLFHIDEAMSWESVRNLRKMKTTFILINNIAVQSNASERVIESIENVRENLNEIFLALSEGENL